MYDTLSEQELRKILGDLESVPKDLQDTVVLHSGQIAGLDLRVDGHDTILGFTADVAVEADNVAMVAAAVEGPLTAFVSASAIQLHPNCKVILDAEAAAALGMSLSHFQRHVQPFLPCVYSGQLRLYRPADLERWSEGAASVPKRR